MKRREFITLLGGAATIFAACCARAASGHSALALECCPLELAGVADAIRDPHQCALVLPPRSCAPAYRRKSCGPGGLRTRFGRGIFPAAGSLPATRRKS